MVKKIGKFVVSTIGITAVTGAASQSLGVSQGSTMSANLAKGSSKVVVPATKIKGASMVLGSVGKLQKKSKKIF